MVKRLAVVVALLQLDKPRHLIHKAVTVALEQLHLLVVHL
jgi:hypothetical protein